MRASGLAMLELRDSSGRILSSGHFRNDYDRVDPALPAALTAATDGAVLARVRTATGSVLALVSADGFRVAGRRFTLLGGQSMDSARLQGLARDGEISVRLVLDDPAPAPGPTVAEIGLPYLDEVAHRPIATARLTIVRDPAPVEALRRSVDRSVLVTLAVALVAALGLATWLAGRIARPLAVLADQTARVDLERLDQDFATDRGDEIGALSRLLAAMTVRLRTGAGRLREAERRAAVGDLARQINHDIKNGLTPIRNVVRHLTQTQEREPERLATVFAERRATLESSVAYLEDLARNYAKLTPALDRSASDPNAVLREVARSVSAPGAVIDTHLAEPVPAVRADGLVLRRILENLVGNALDALGGNPGRVTLASATVTDNGGSRVRLTVTDSGRGMTGEELEHAFDDFYTTKPAGTGLGLSVVRRLVTDLGGTMRVETSPGRGSTFTVELPAA